MMMAMLLVAVEEKQILIRSYVCTTHWRVPHLMLRYALIKKLRDYLGIFPKYRTPSFENPRSNKEIVVILQFFLCFQGGFYGSFLVLGFGNWEDLPPMLGKITNVSVIFS